MAAGRKHTFLRVRVMEKSATNGLVLHLVPRFRRGGAEDVIRSLALRCEPRGMIGTTAGDWTPDLQVLGVPVVALPLFPSTLANAVRSFFALRRVVSENRIGIVHSHHRFTSLIGRAVAAVERVPFVSTVHDLASGNRFLTRMGIGRVVTVFSEAVSEHLRKAFRVPAERIERVPMGLFEESSTRLESFVLEKNRTSVIAFAGRLAVEKGIHVLVEALALMQGRVAAKALIIGDGEERDSIIQTLQARGLADSVTLTGFVEDIGPLLARSDVVVVPSLREGFGRVVIQALAAGVPVVASATGGIVELVRDQENGLLVPAGDAQALADAIVRVLADRDLAAHLRDGARAAPIEVYSVQSMADAMSRIYRRLNPALGGPA